MVSKLASKCVELQHLNRMDPQTTITKALKESRNLKRKNDAFRLLLANFIRNREAEQGKLLRNKKYKIASQYYRSLKISHQAVNAICIVYPNKVQDKMKKFDTRLQNLMKDPEKHSFWHEYSDAKRHGNLEYLKSNGDLHFNLNPISLSNPVNFVERTQANLYEPLLPNQLPMFSGPECADLLHNFSKRPRENYIREIVLNLTILNTVFYFCITRHQTQLITVLYHFLIIEAGCDHTKLYLSIQRFFFSQLLLVKMSPADYVQELWEKKFDLIRTEAPKGPTFAFYFKKQHDRLVNAFNIYTLSKFVAGSNYQSTDPCIHAFISTELSPCFKKANDGIQGIIGKYLDTSSRDRRKE
jgi:hypothetical protein